MRCGRCVLAWLAVGMIVFGTASTELSKIQFTTYSDGVESCPAADDDGRTKYCLFDKPYFNVLIMKVGMSLCFFAHKYEQRQRDKQRAEFDREKQAPLIQNEGGLEATELIAPPPEVKWGTIVRIIVPSFTDLLQTVLNMAGLIFVEGE